MPTQLITLQRHIGSQQSLHPGATGEFTRLMWDLVIAFKLIHRDVNKAGLVDILGATDRQNIHGEQVMRLDWLAQERIYHAMNHGGHLCVMASEESDDIITVGSRHPASGIRRAITCSSMILSMDHQILTPMSVSARYSLSTAERRLVVTGLLRIAYAAEPNRLLPAYVIYGSSTMLVYTTGSSVDGFTLDPTMGEFLLSHADIKIPDRSMYYSINEGNSAHFDAVTRKYLEYLKTTDGDTGRPYSARYIGSLVADFHRNMLKGGIFLYPAAPRAKLRLLYEAIPLAFIAEQAGGAASDGKRRIMDIQPSELHEKTALAIRNRDDVETYERFLKKG